VTIPLADALRLIERRCQPLARSERIVLSRIDRRILAEDIRAPMALPSTDNSAVDGYGFRHADFGLATGCGLQLVGISAAGRPLARTVGQGEAVRILTGGVPPSGVDTIAMQEDVERVGDCIRMKGGISLHANIRRQGEDIAAGSIVFSAGRVLGPVDLALLASLGFAEVPVHGRLRVALLSTGDELVEAGGIRRPGSIYDANRPALCALLRRTGCDVTDLGIVADNRDRLGSTLKSAAAGHDAILTSAGVSAGDEDHVRSAVQSLGGLDFQGVAIKPGRPIAVGHVAGVPFFGLPGNPAATLISFLFIVRPALQRLAGAAVSPPRRHPVQADFAMTKRAGRREFIRCRLVAGENWLSARRTERDGAGILSSLSDADGLLEFDEATTEILPGDILPFIPFSELGL